MFCICAAKCSVFHAPYVGLSPGISHFASQHFSRLSETYALRSMQQPKTWPGKQMFETKLIPYKTCNTYKIISLVNWEKILKCIMWVDNFFKRLSSKNQIMPWNPPFVSQCCTSTSNASVRSQTAGGWEAALLGAEAEGAAAKPPREPAWGGRGQLVQSVTETLSLPLQRAGTPWLHRRQAAVSQSTKLRAQSTSEWWKPSASFNLKLLGWSWHPHKNNTYYVVSISSRSPGWLNDNSYLTEHWKLLLHLIVDLSITNFLLGK